MSRLNHIQNLRQIFQKSVDSVRPFQLLSESNGFYLNPDQGSILLRDKKFEIADKKCHVVGFGKAVLGMAAQLEKSLGGYLHDGVISIPKGSIEQFRNVPEMSLKAISRIQVVESSEHNQPDEAAAEVALIIKQLAAAMTSHDILFVLISGGGSALLPMPKAPCLLHEKLQLIRQLANAGASIDEMNVVRICLSDIKGGRLAYAGRNAYAVISFIISDIIGDPPHLIASGPTCAMRGEAIKTAQDVLMKYEMWQGMPGHLRLLVEHECGRDDGQKPGSNNYIYIVGNNRVATATAEREATSRGYQPFVATTALQGEVATLSEMYIDFLGCLFEYRRQNCDTDALKEDYPFDAETFEGFLLALKASEKNKKPLLLILAGEPTVQVTGSGLGGRNQEFALRMSLNFHTNSDLYENVCFLSAGTDGIDGPTPAAGAIGSSAVIKDYLKAGGSLQRVCDCLSNNDSYNLYAQINDGEYHVVTGHTGTNVMDLQFLLVP